MALIHFATVSNRLNLVSQNSYFFLFCAFCRLALFDDFKWLIANLNHELSRWNCGKVPVSSSTVLLRLFFLFRVLAGKQVSGKCGNCKYQ